MTAWCGSLRVSRLCGTEQQAGFGKQWKKAGGGDQRAKPAAGLVGLREYISRDCFCPLMTHDKNLHMRRHTCGTLHSLRLTCDSDSAGGGPAHKSSHKLISPKRERGASATFSSMTLATFQLRQRRNSSGLMSLTGAGGGVGGQRTWSKYLKASTFRIRLIKAGKRLRQMYEGRTQGWCGTGVGINQRGSESSITLSVLRLCCQHANK